MITTVNPRYPTDEEYKAYQRGLATGLNAATFKDVVRNKINRLIIRYAKRRS